MQCDCKPSTYSTSQCLEKTLYFIQGHIQSLGTSQRGLQLKNCPVLEPLQSNVFKRTSVWFNQLYLPRTHHLHPSLLRVYNIIYSRVRFRFLYFNVGYFLCPNRPDREAVVLAVGWKSEVKVSVSNRSIEMDYAVKQFCQVQLFQGRNITDPKQNTLPY